MLIQFANYHQKLTQLNMSDTNSTKLLEAQGQLNREIQAALKHFSTRMLETINPSLTKQAKQIKQNEYQKEGPQKKFIFRQSLLSTMFQVRDFRTIYNMMVASFIILTISLLYDSFSKKGQFLDKISLFVFFKGSRTVIVAWIMLTLIFYCIIFITKIALHTNKYVWIPLYLLHIAANTSTAIYFSQSNQQMGFASVIIIMSEGIRMVMKAHSYIRTKLLYLKDNQFKNFEFKGIRVINSKQKVNQNQKDQKLQRFIIKNGDIFSQIQKLSYFFFAPTLIYRDSYILTAKRSFKNIVIHFINFLACIYYSFIIYQSWCKPIIEDLEKNIDIQTLCSTIINLMLPSVLFLILGFFGFLHSWLNLWAQITRFPDRAFYSDWWNSIEFGSYYRKWNIVVHDWLYYYIYLDIYRFFPTLRKARMITQLLTFIISAIIHEWIIYYAIGFFYPILFILFAGPGILFMQVTSLRKTSVNLIFWLEMYIGSAMMFTFYLVECFARQKITDAFIHEQWGSLSFLIPRTFYLGQ